MLCVTQAELYRHLLVEFSSFGDFIEPIPAGDGNDFTQRHFNLKTGNCRLILYKTNRQCTILNAYYAPFPKNSTSIILKLLSLILTMNPGVRSRYLYLAHCSILVMKECESPGLTFMCAFPSYNSAVFDITFHAPHHLSPHLIIFLYFQEMFIKPAKPYNYVCIHIKCAPPPKI